MKFTTLAEIKIAAATTDESLGAIRTLLREYAEYLKHSPGVQGMCFASYEEELKSLPGPYTTLLLATSGAELAGCVLLRPLPAEETACEMKRLWVRADFRKLGIGRMLTEQLILEAKEQGFTAMYLDTVPAAMQQANRLYRELGFEPVPRYNQNEVSGVEFFRLPLTK